MYFKYLILAAVLCGMVFAQSNELDELIKDRLPSDVKVSDEDIEKAKKQVTQLSKEKCAKNGHPEAYEDAHKAVFEVFPACVKEELGLNDTKVLEAQIEKAKENGTVDEVFKKYCARSPLVKECFKNMTESIKPCFSVEEQKNLRVLYNLTEQLAEFICHKDGDRIALFIAEGGPKCFESKKEAVQDCLNSTFGADYQAPNPENITSFAIPEIAFGEKECRQIDDLEQCIVNELSSCEVPTSANIVESLFKFARQATPCKKVEEGAQKRSQESKPKTANAAGGLAVTTMTVLLAITASLF